jgi:hydroxymethylpyrimidine pyrophosphatase-like HAD family hydrolase
MKQYHIITFGCQMNKSDSERIASLFEQNNYIETQNIKEADTVILNMCSVRQSAVDRVYGLIPQLQKLKAEIIITGCILDKDKKRLGENFTILNKKDFKKDFFSISPKYSSNIQAFVPVSDGCNNFCTYCVVPFTRGKLVSRNYNQIIKEVESLVKKGYKEIWLLGQNVNQYNYNGVDFADLIKKIDEIDGKFWIRFTSPNPKDFSDKIINALSKSSKFAPYLNLPLQSGDDDILKAMNRSYTAEKYYQLVTKIRKKIKDISISTDIKEINNVSVFARVNPEHKLRIVNLFRSQGKIIAMTGDGVNDAPSLVAADLGISMGKIGTEVAKEASDIILLDDNFETIVSAIEEGRGIYKSIKKVLSYLLSTGLAEVLVILVALLLDMPLPLIAVQIIWLNFVTDGILDASLAFDPREDGLLNKKFEKPNKYLIDKLMAQRMIIFSLIMGIGTLLLFKQYYMIDITKAQTICLTVLAVFQWFNVWNCRSETKSIFNKDMFSNKFLVYGTIAAVLLQLAAVYNPFMQSLLGTTALTIQEWEFIILMASSIIIVEEARKFFVRST